MPSILKSSMSSSTTGLNPIEETDDSIGFLISTVLITGGGGTILGVEGLIVEVTSPGGPSSRS